MKIRFVLVSLIGLGGVVGCGSDKVVPAVVTEEQQREQNAEQKAVDQEEKDRAKSLKETARPVDQAEFEERHRSR